MPEYQLTLDGGEEENCKMVICTQCEQEKEEPETNEIDGEIVCEDCSTYCDKCDEYFISEAHNFGDMVYCDDCYDKHIVVCSDRCSCLIDTDTDKDENGDDSMYFNNRYVCNSCSEEYSSCEGCNEIYHRDNLYYCEAHGRTYCEGCEPDTEDDEDTSSTIHKYTHKPSPIFHGDGPGHYGVEVEVNISKTAAEDVQDINSSENKFYLKEDGSIDGFEIVTHPCSLSYHENNFPWQEITTACKNRGGKSHNTDNCGLHIHMSRAFFTETELTRFVAFINIQKEFMVKFARRNSEQWGKYKNKGFRYSPDRYEAVNLQNRETVEVRIFKGTLAYKTIIASIQLLDLVRLFVKTCSIAAIIGKPVETLEKFKKIIETSRKTELIEYCKKKGLIPCA